MHKNIFSLQAHITTYTKFFINNMLLHFHKFICKYSFVPFLELIYCTTREETRLKERKRKRESLFLSLFLHIIFCAKI